MNKIKIHNNEHPIFNFLKQKNDLFLFDTETTGLGTRDEPAEMVELYGIKYGLEKNLNVKLISQDEKHTQIEISFNNYKKIVNIKNVDKNSDLLTLLKEKGLETTDGSLISVNENIPFIFEKDKNKLLFNSIGELTFKEEVDKLYKSRKPIEIGGYGST